MIGNQPPLEEAKQVFAEFCQTIAALRHPERGCPWDLEQTHATLRRYMIEEAYEAAEQMEEGGHPHELRDELGDVLLQVVLNAQLAMDEGQFSIVDVIRSINRKMIRRHPHVFAGEEFESKEKLRADWEAIKASEASQNENAAQADKGVFDDVIRYPATLQAFEIGKQARKISFDWQVPGEVLEKLKSEVTELELAMKTAQGKPTNELRAELGDVFFTWVQLCRHLGWEPETVGLDGNRKFLDRFKVLEALAAEQGLNVKEASQETLEKLWQQAKKKTKANT